MEYSLPNIQKKFFNSQLELFDSPARGTSGGLKLHNRRYIGSKYKLISWIFSIIHKECRGDCFADIFAGTGIVGAAASRTFKHIILNDFLYSNTIIYKAFFENKAWNFKKITTLVNNYNSLAAHFLKNNYFSKHFGGKYFSTESAKIIGFIRQNIEDNKQHLTRKEYYILIASLLYSADKIANTVGHYDAYCKKPAVRDKFQLHLIEPSLIKSLKIFREDANLLIKKIKPDIVYIDPPYNSRQYSRFYHVLETLAKWDCPKLYGTALKPMPENISHYCKTAAKEQLTDLINTVQAKYLVVSYNNTYQSKSRSSQNKITLKEIKNILSQRGPTKIFEKHYRYFNTGRTDFKNHKEYLFVTKSLLSSKIKRSPLFYVGDKYKLIRQLNNFFPKKINYFYDPFTGGGSVFLNIQAKKYFLNDINSPLIDIHKFLTNSASHQNKFFKDLDSIIQKYNFSYSYKTDIVPGMLKKRFKKTYYAKFNKAGYEKLRKHANQSKKTNPLVLYILLIYGFNRMLRFNKNKKFNLPVGNVDLNQNVIQALKDYFLFVKTADLQFTSMDFKHFLKSKTWLKNDFIYLDPPYLIAGSEYNKIWNKKQELDLLKSLNDLNKKKVKFALSNIIQYNNKTNTLLKNWMKQYNVHPIKSHYINYHNNKKKSIKEVLITNY